MEFSAAAFPFTGICGGDTTINFDWRGILESRGLGARLLGPGRVEIVLVVAVLREENLKAFVSTTAAFKVLAGALLLLLLGILGKHDFLVGVTLLTLLDGVALKTVASFAARGRARARARGVGIFLVVVAAAEEARTATALLLGGFLVATLEVRLFLAAFITAAAVAIAAAIIAAAIIAAAIIVAAAVPAVAVAAVISSISAAVAMASAIAALASSFMVAPALLVVPATASTAAPARLAIVLASIAPF